MYNFDWEREVPGTSVIAVVCEVMPRPIVFRAQSKSAHRASMLIHLNSLKLSDF